MVASKHGEARYEKISKLGAGTVRLSAFILLSATPSSSLQLHHLTLLPVFHHIL